MPCVLSSIGSFIFPCDNFRGSDSLSLKQGALQGPYLFLLLVMLVAQALLLATMLCLVI